MFSIENSELVDELIVGPALKDFREIAER